MVVTLSNIISEVKADFKSYYSSGLLDEVSMERWGLQALKMFGVNIMVLQDHVVKIEDGSGELPDNFFSLYAAYECNPIKYDAKTISTLQNVRQWKETTEDIRHFNSCEPCCVTETEKIITEKYYHDEKEHTFQYGVGGLLTLGRGMKSSCFNDNCRNKFVKDNPREISIRNLKLYTNYPKGNVYMIYYGLEYDEDGDILITDTSRGALATYVEDFIKYKVVEKIVINQDDTNLSSMIGLLKQNMKDSYILAQADAKFDNLSPDAFKRLKLSNAQDLMVYENMVNRVKKF